MCVVNYYDKIVLHGFTVFDYVSCEPSSFSCFVYCEEECAYDEPYAKIEKSGKNVPVCDPTANDCEELSCFPGEKNCAIKYCIEDSLEPGEVCHQDSMLEEEVEI